MTKEEAVRNALEYVQEAKLEVGAIVDVKYIDLESLDAKAKDCPPDLLETYDSVRKTFRNQWVVAFMVNEKPGQVSCPETKLVCVFESGEATLFSSP